MNILELTDEQLRFLHIMVDDYTPTDEDDLIEEITTSSGWCIKSIDYDIQLK